jgi:DNA-directed RNA polymerase alpha subunit
MAKKLPQTAPKPGETTDMDKYEPFDAEWRKIGLSAPARRALVNAKLYKVSDLRKITSAELDQMHGIGKSAIARVKQIMEAKKIRFRIS